MLSYNEKTGQTEYKSVLATFSHEAREVLDVTIEGEPESLGVTPQHPFFVHRARDNTSDGDSDDEDAGVWIAAGKLREGDRVLRPNGEWVRVVRIEKREGGAAVYNFSVADNHTYFVGKLGVLAHNTCPELVDPESVSFTQRTIGEEVFEYADDMLNGRWDWSRSGPLRVTEVNGRFVSYDNRRLAAARLAGLREVPIQRVNLDEVIPVPNARKTWRQAFEQRRTDPRNVREGGVVPPEGIADLPDIASPR